AVADLSEASTRLVALHQESSAALVQPKSARRPELAQQFFDETNALLGLLDRISTQLNRAVRLEDALIDQLLEMKQLAWMARNAGGDMANVSTQALAGVPLPPNALIMYYSDLAKVEAAWSALEGVAGGLSLPDDLTKALDTAKKEFFAADYAEMRIKTLKA